MKEDSLLAEAQRAWDEGKATGRQAPLFVLHKAVQPSQAGAWPPILLGPAFLRGEIIGLSIEHQDSNKA